MVTMRQARAALGLSDISLTVPLLVVLAGILVGATGRSLGPGIAVGSLMAVANSALLMKRVEFAVDSPSVAVATVSMQVGLVATFLAFGAITLLLLIISVPMAIAMGVTFFAVQTVEILFFVWSRHLRGRSSPQWSER